ncbi:g10161 [Coccomyxa elongata]
MVEYLIKWKDGAPNTWEPESNLADNLLRDFETMWWTACREGDEAKLKKLLSTSGRVLANIVDENRRSGLHFVAAIGNVPCTKMFCQAGADLNLGDKEGYTPLHMAVGYSHVATVAALLEAGADPEVQDRQSRDVIALVESIREKMPIAPEYMGRRMALEQVTALLADNLFEEVEPVAVLKARKNENGTRDFLVKWSDGSEDSWVPQWNVANDVVEDFDAGLEYGEAERILKSVQRGDTREYLVQWKDDYPDSWEVEDHLPQHIIAEFEERQRQRLLSTMHTVTDAQNSSSRSRAPRDKHSAGRREPAAQAV